MEDIIDATGSVGSGNISTDMQVETQKGSSKLLGIASKVMPLVLAASAGGATGGVMSNSLTADSDNSHAIVNFVHKADASGSEMIVQNKDQGIFNEVMRAIHNHGPSKKTAADEVAVACQIAFGAHGFGDRFTPDNPLIIVPIGNPHRDELSVERLKEELEPVVEQYGDRVLVSGFTSPF
jgi:hypothetical protein